MVRTVAAEMKKVTDDYEVLVVDDGSADETGAILDRLSRELPFLRIIHHKGNQGYGAALISGFYNARKDLIFYTDGDGQYDVREIHNLLREMAPGVQIVNGYKVKRSDPWYRIWIGEAYRRAMRCLFRLSIRDVDCDFRLFRREIFSDITLESQSGVICVEMARKFQVAGFRMVEVPVSHYPRMHGSSEFFRIRHLTHTMRGLLKIWWRMFVVRRLPVWMTVAGKSGYRQS
jgi:glycosyltransferase involved in cell wall biosynthesis